MRFWFIVAFGVLLGTNTGSAARVSDVQAGQAAFQAGKYANAISSFSNVIATGKADKKILAKVFFMRGSAYQRLKRLTPAIADFSNAIWLDELPVSLQSRAYISRGQLRLLMSQHAEALKDMNEAVRLAPSALSYSARAEALIRLGRSAQALADLDRALSDKGAVKYHIHYIRAQAFEALGRAPDAKANLRKSLVYKPDFAPSRRMLTALGGAVRNVSPKFRRLAAKPAKGRHRLSTGSITPGPVTQKSYGDAAEQDWMLATRTTRSQISALRPPETRRAARVQLRREPSGRGYVIQLSARRTLETAKIALHHIASVNRDLLAGRELFVEKARSAKLGEIYRVRVGYFAARKEPSELCGKLKLRGQSCFLARK